MHAKSTSIYTDKNRCPWLYAQLRVRTPIFDVFLLKKHSSSPVAGVLGGGWGWWRWWRWWLVGWVAGWLGII